MLRIFEKFYLFKGSTINQSIKNFRFGISEVHQIQNEIFEIYY